MKDQVSLLDGREVNSIFDVGANIGTVANQYHRYFPKAYLHCFEPIPTLAEKLRSNLDGQDVNYSLYTTALSASAGQACFHVNQVADTSSLHAAAVNVPPSYAGIMHETASITVNTTTVDRVCGGGIVPPPQVLKIDTQGHELDVLKGASGLLAKHIIDVIVAELWLQPMYDDISLAGEVIQYLAGYGYRLHNLYEPCFSGATGKIRWFNALLVSPALYQRSYELQAKAMQE